MLTSPLLPQQLGYIRGTWVGADSGELFPVINPSNGAHLADVPRMGAEETVRAIEAAQQAMQMAPAIEKRREWLQAIGDKLLEHQAELGRIITLEHGKTLKDGVSETVYAAGFFHYIAAQLEALNSHDVAGRPRGCDWKIHQRPAGVVGSITPWNFPLAMMAKKVAPALGAGCAIVAKPASLTPLTAIAFASLCEMVGLPAGMFNLITGDSSPIGKTLCSHPAVRIVSFTGSTEVGKKLAQLSAPHIKRLALELGGSAPFVVFDDADLKLAANHLVANKFRCGGQTCVCTNRIYVQRNIAKHFPELVVEQTEKLIVGDGMDPTTDIGPLINRDGWDKVARHVKNALENGATRLVGGDPPRPEHQWGAFYPPTVLTNINPSMQVCREETFGPVAAIGQFETEAEALSAANSTEYGLAAYVFTGDQARAQRMAAGLQFGHVGLNTSVGPTPEAPFGGMKMSGYGREGGLEGLLEFCEPQAVVRG